MSDADAAGQSTPLQVPAHEDEAITDHSFHIVPSDDEAKFDASDNDDGMDDEEDDYGASPPSRHFEEAMLSSDEDPESEEEWLDPDNPLMARVQAALAKQLSKARDDVTVELQGKEETLSRLKQDRESVGVRLYRLQQQLAKMQLQLERTHEEFNRARADREELEDRAQSASFMLQEKQEEERAMEKQVQEAQAELDKLNISLKELERFNKDLEGDIQVTRREAYGAEDHMKRVEKEKVSQDELLDRLTENLRQTQEQVVMYDEQLESQRGATRDAARTLAEAEEEMAKIRAEKKEYMSMWKNSLVGMARRDEALRNAESAIAAQRERILSMRNELIGYRDLIKAEQTEHEKTTAVLQRVQAEVQYLEKQIAENEETRRSFTEQYHALRASLERVDRELELTNSNKKTLESENRGLRQKREALVQRKKALDDRVMAGVGEQVTLQKGAQNVYKATLKLRERIHAHEMQLVDVENELARIRIDSLNTEAHNKELAATAEQFENELKEKDALIEKYEQEIRQRHDTVEKKQIFIVRLNKKYNALTANREEANTGPLEATINHLNKEIASRQQESAELQRRWIKAQTSLVSLVGKIEDRKAQHDELEARKTILSQRQMRTDRQVEQQKSEIAELERGVRRMHNGFSKINELIAKNKALGETLRNDSFNLENEFVELLKELEEETVKLEERLVELKDEKEKLLQDVIEAERQIMLWEKKIKLERETQAALDPNHGQPEIRGMKKEIHRMQLHMAKLRRKQERMIQEMERAVAKQESIKLTHTSAKSRDHYTQATLKKSIMTLKKNLKRNIRSSKKLDEEIERQDEAYNQLLDVIRKEQDEFGRLEDARQERLEQLEEAGFRRRLLNEQVIAAQKRARHFSDVADGRRSTRKAVNSQQHLTQSLLAEQRKSDAIKAALEQLKGEQPMYQVWFDRLGAFA